MTRRGLLVRLALLATAGAGAWFWRDQFLWPEPEPQFDATGATPWLDFVLAGDLPVIEVEVAGQRLKALIDSGAQRSVLDRSLAVALNLGQTFDMPMVAFGVGGKAQLGRGTRLDVQMPGLALRQQAAAILDLGPLAQDPQLGVGLILGQDMLRTLVLDLDADARRVRLVRQGRPLEFEGAEPVEVIKARAGLEVSVKVEGQTMRALLDTGSSAALALSRSTAQRLGLLQGRPQGEARSVVLGGETEAVTVGIAALEIAGVHLGSQTVAVYADNLAPGYPKALVGMQAFRGGRLVMDIDQGRVAVRQAPLVTLG